MENYDDVILNFEYMQNEMNMENQINTICLPNGQIVLTFNMDNYDNLCPIIIFIGKTMRKTCTFSVNDFLNRES